MSAKEKTGYPTQKSLALLDRIIATSSNTGDMALDPSCGCATALMAVDRMERQWAGIDLSPLAIRLVDEWIQADLGWLPWGGAMALAAPPVRTDLNYRTHRHRLNGEKEDVCAGCETHFPFRVMNVVHIPRRSCGDTNHLDNIQFLCSDCNRSKGVKTTFEWRALQ